MSRRLEALTVEWSLTAGLTEDGTAGNGHRLRQGAHDGWEAALFEFEHQAEHWDTPDHGETGHLIAQALRSAVDIAESGGLRCEHRLGCVPGVGPNASSARDEASRARDPRRSTTGLPEPEPVAATRTTPGR